MSTTPAVSKTKSGKVKIVLDNDMALEFIHALHVVPIEVPAAEAVRRSMENLIDYSDDTATSGRLVGVFKPWSE